MRGSLGWKLVLANLGRSVAPHLPFALVCVAVAAKEFAIVGQLGRALNLGGARLVLSTIGAMLVLAPLSLRCAGRRQILALLLVDLAITVLTLGDLLHYRAFGSLPSVTQLGVAWQLVSVRSAVFDLVQPRDALLFADVLALAVAWAAPHGTRWRRVSWGAACACVAAGTVTIVLPAMDSPRFNQPWNGKAFLAGDLGLVGYHVWEAFDAARHAWGREDVSTSAVEAAAERLRQARVADARPPSFGAAAGRNVILLQVESFQGFAAGLEVRGQKVTPRFDALAAESLVFGRFFHSATFMGRTSDAQFTSNCSILPSSVAPVASRYSENEFRCLATVLADAGWNTAALQPLEPDYWNASVMQRAMGFARSYSVRDFVYDERVGMGLSDASFLRQVGEELRRLPEPFFANVLTVSSHIPFDWPGIPQTLDLGPLQGTKVGRYLQSIHYADGAIGAFVDALRAEGLLDRTVLVVFGDHDAWTRTNSNLADVIPLDPSDEGGWFEEERRIPLAIRLPAGALAGPVDTVGSQLDLAPTVLGLLGLGRDGTFFQGRDLLAPAAEPIAPMPDGSAFGRDLVFLSERRTMGQGLCFSKGVRLPLERCDDLRARARAEVDLSNEILAANLLPALKRALVVSTATP